MSLAELKTTVESTAMSAEDQADWLEIFKHLETPEQCDTCQEFRATEASITVRKGDTKKEKREKSRKRRQSRQLLDKHMREVEHIVQDIVWPATRLNEMLRQEDEDQSEEEEEEEKEPIEPRLLGLPEEIPLNSVTVGGTVPQHHRELPPKVLVNDMVIVRAAEAETGNEVLYVATVTKVRPSLEIHWYDIAKRANDALGGGYKPVWIDMSNKHYRSDKIKNKQHRPLVNNVMEGNILVWGWELSNDKVPLTVRRRLCAWPEVLYKIPDHDVNCKCKSRR